MEAQAAHPPPDPGEGSQGGSNDRLPASARSRPSTISQLSMDELPFEGTPSVPNSTTPLTTHMNQKGAKEAVDSAVTHTIHFQRIMKTNMQRMEEQLLESFTRSMADLMPKEVGNLKSHDASDSDEEFEVREDYSAPTEFVGDQGPSPVRTPYTNETSGMQEMRTNSKKGPLHAHYEDVNPTFSADSCSSKPAPKLANRLAKGHMLAMKRSTSALSLSSGEGGMPRRLNRTGSADHPGSAASSSENIKGTMESVASWILDRQRTQSPFAERIWRFMEDPESGMLAHLFHKINIPLIWATVVITLLQTLPNSPLSGALGMTIETGIDSVFMLEAIVRFSVSPMKYQFLLDAYNVIDVLAALPLILRVISGFELAKDEDDWLRVALLCYVPVLRLLKVLRRYRQFHLLLKAFRLACEALPVLLFCYCVGLLVFAALLYSFEREHDVTSLAQALWLGLVTMTTVGYGDIYPKTTYGKIVTSILTIMSSLYMAVPLGIIGNCFHQVWSDRDRILLMQILKQRLRQWGYTAADIPKLFENFDMDGDGCLDFQEFNRMICKLRLGLSEERAWQLFETFDEDHGGSIDDKEFVRATFPTHYHLIYGTSKGDETTRSTIAASIVQLVRNGSTRFPSFASQSKIATQRSLNPDSSQTLENQRAAGGNNDART